ncbi:hypothetical protein F5I97DRAFT_1886985 [Phlebopus sp. FC_14]|nr:hypothetical protein F5I97DRAFT_1886985 [Phlebopus sp. FC_14]
MRFFSALRNSSKPKRALTKAFLAKYIANVRDDIARLYETSDALNDKLATLEAMMSTTVALENASLGSNKQTALIEEIAVDNRSTTAYASYIRQKLGIYPPTPCSRCAHLPLDATVTKPMKPTHRTRVRDSWLMCLVNTGEKFDQNMILWSIDTDVLFLLLGLLYFVCLLTCSC